MDCIQFSRWQELKFLTHLFIQQIFTLHLLCDKNSILDPGDKTKSKMNLVPAYMELAYILLKADR